MGIFTSFTAGAALFYSQRFFPYLSISVFIILFLYWGFSKYRSCKPDTQSIRSMSVLAAVIAVPLVLASLGYWRAAASVNPPPEFRELSGQVISIKGSPSAEPLALQKDSSRFVNEIDVTEAAVNTKHLNIEKMRLFTEGPLIVGKAYIISAKIPADSTFLNPGSKEWMLSGYAVGIQEQGTSERNFLERARDRLNAYLSKNFSGDISAFLMSIITGDRGAMSAEMKNAFNVTGLAHILSISGAHFGLLLFILFKFFRLLIKLLPPKILGRMSLYASPSQIAAALSFPVITAYLGISTMEFPAVRSYIMITLFLFGLLIQRKGFWMNTLLFAAALIILIQPDALVQLSCQLSFLAVLCLGFYADLERRRKERINAREHAGLSEDSRDSLPPHRGVIKKALSASSHYVLASSMISVAATAGTAPLVAYSFNYFSIISPLSNLIVTPLIGFVILPIALLSSFTYLIFGFFPLRSFIDAATGLSLEMTKYMGSWQYAAIPVPTFPAILLLTFYAGLIGYAVINRNGDSPESTDTEAKVHSERKLVIASVALAIVPILFYACFTAAKERGMSVTFLDVGQGDSAVIELPDSRVVIIDTGKNGFQTSGYLKYRGYRKIDLLVLTHGHPDHSGGFWYLSNNYQIAEIWDNNFIVYGSDLPSGAIRRNVVRGDFVGGKDYSVAILHPYKGFYTIRSGNDAENNQSVVLRIAGKKLSVLFTGDISSEAEEDILHLGRHLKSVALKVPHHGSRRSLTEDFLQQVKPDIAVISAGRNNMFGHPHADTLSRLAETKIYRTDRDGAVCVSEDADGTIKIRTWEEMRLKEAKKAEDEFLNIKRLFELW